MSDMDDSDMQKVIERLKKNGFKSSSKSRSKRPLAPRSDLRLVHVLWKKLGEAGVLERPDRAGLNAFVRKTFGESWGSVPTDIDALTDADQINAVIRALKAWGQRAQIDFDFGRVGR